MHLLSFIGTGRYAECVYALDGRAAIPTPYPQLALPELLEDCSGVTVFETEEAKQAHREALTTAAGSRGILIDFVRIPSGKSEAEQWEIFSIIDETASRHEEVALDVTHGFRTLPLLGFLSAVFLRVTGKVRFARMLYGAWEATDATTGITPVFDLTPFLSLVDWMTASHVFLKAGNATELAALLRERQRELWKADAEPGSALPKSLTKLAGALESAADSLLLLRRHQRDEAISSVLAQIAVAQTEIPAFARPFATILDSVTATFARFRGHSELETERRQIEWLIERGHTDAALTLAREWMVSWTALQLGEGEIPQDYQSRKPYETFLNAASGHPHIGPEKVREDLRPHLAESPWTTGARAVWNGLTEPRNDLNHAGYNKQPLHAARLKAHAGKAITDLMELAVKQNAPSRREAME